jgi:hypothetical protein
LIFLQQQKIRRSGERIEMGKQPGQKNETPFHRHVTPCLIGYSILPFRSRLKTPVLRPTPPTIISLQIFSHICHYLPDSANSSR